MKRWVLYILYIFVAVVFFLYYLFPSDAAKDFIASYLQRKQPDYQVAVEQVKPVFPAGIRLRTLDISYKNDVWLELDQLTVTPNYLSLFSDKKSFNFKASAYEGEVSGKIFLTGEGSPFEISGDADLHNIRLDDIQRLQTLVGRKFQGNLNGVVRYHNNKGADRKIDMELNLSNCTVKIDHPLITSSIDQVTFKTIDAVVAIDQQALELKQCKGLGTQADGDLSGTMRFRRPFAKSLLEFRGTLKLHHNLLASIQNILPRGTYQPRKSESGGLPIKLYGTIEKPRFSFR